MKHIFRFLATIAFLCTTMVLVGCNPDAPLPDDDNNEQTTPDEEEKPDDEPQKPEPPQEAPFTVEVIDITSTEARVSVSPTDKQTTYYFDILRKEYYTEYETVFGWQKFIDNTIISAGAALQLEDRAEILKRMLSSGDDSYGFTNLMAATDYYAVAMGVDKTTGTITTAIVAVPFKTAEPAVSTNSFAITLSDITYSGAKMTIKPSEAEDQYIIDIVSKLLVDEMGDEQYMTHCIQNRGNLVSLSKGEVSTTIDSCQPGRDYYVAVFGYEGGMATTALTKEPFSTKAGGDPANCSFTFSIGDISYNTANITITASDPHVVFYWDAIDKELYEAALSQPGADANKIMREHLTGHLDIYKQDFLGNIYETLEVVGSYGKTNTQSMTMYGLMEDTAYIPWAVCIDAHGEPIGEFCFGTPFVTKADVISEAVVSVKGSYYMGSDGRAVLASEVTCNDKVVNFYNSIFAGDLTGSTRRSLINNLVQRGFKNERLVMFDKCPWSAATALAVGEDKDGNYGEVVMYVIHPNKQDAQPFAMAVETLPFSSLNDVLQPVRKSVLDALRVTEKHHRF